MVTVTQILSLSNKSGFRTQSRVFNIVEFEKHQYGSIYSYLRWAKSRADLIARQIELTAIGRLNFYAKIDAFFACKIIFG